MRSTLMLAVLLTMSAIWLQAQSGSQGSNNVGQQATVQGCLQSSGGHYTLTKSDGKVIDLRGDARLSRYVGHEVEITGKRSVRTRDTTQEGTASTASERPAIDVKSARKISDTCNSPGQ